MRCCQGIAILTPVTPSTNSNWGKNWQFFRFLNISFLLMMSGGVATQVQVTGCSLDQSPQSSPSRWSWCSPVHFFSSSTLRGCCSRIWCSDTSAESAEDHLPATDSDEKVSPDDDDCHLVRTVSCWVWCEQRIMKSETDPLNNPCLSWESAESWFYWHTSIRTPAFLQRISEDLLMNQHCVIMTSTTVSHCLTPRIGWELILVAKKIIINVEFSSFYFKPHNQQLCGQ